MTSKYQPQGLQDSDLIAKLVQLAQREKQQMAELLAHLAELDERQLYLDMGFRSTWEYCILALGFCETSAWRRYTAARVCRRFPHAFELVATGELQLSVLAALAKHLTAENVVELFEACRRQSIRRVEQLIAARFPVPDVPDSVRRLPDRPGAVSQLEVADAVATSCAGNEPVPPTYLGEMRAMPPPRALPLPPSPAMPGAESRRCQVEPLSAERFAVRFTADAELLELLEEVRALASHRNPNGDLLSTMKAGLEAYRRELLKDRFAVGRKPRAVSKPQPPAAPPAPDGLVRRASEQSGPRRAVPANVAREIYERDGGQCTFVAPDGRRCSARRFLEIDHIRPHGVGGDEQPQNLRLRCRAHNQHYARRYFGRGYMASVLKSAQKRKKKSG